MGRRFLEQNTTQSTLSGSGSQQMNPLGNRGRGRTQPSVKRSYDIGGVDGPFSPNGMSSNPCFICGATGAVTRASAAISLLGSWAIASLSASAEKIMLRA